MARRQGCRAILRLAGAPRQPGVIRFNLQRAGYDALINEKEKSSLSAAPLQGHRARSSRPVQCDGAATQKNGPWNSRHAIAAREQGARFTVSALLV